MTREEMQQKVLEDLKSEFGGKITETFFNYGMPVALVDSGAWHDIVAWLKNHESWAFNHFIDITAVDYKGRQDDWRYEVVLHLRSHSNNVKVRLKTRLGEENPALATLTDLFVGASWSEREVYDLMGVTFEGHPRMTRLLNPDDFVGHPLRKDFPVKGLHRGSFPRGTVISNKRREPVNAKQTKPKPADQILPNTPIEQRREPMREEDGNA